MSYLPSAYEMTLGVLKKLGLNYTFCSVKLPRMLSITENRRHTILAESIFRWRGINVTIFFRR